MPIYEYHCEECGNKFEEIESFHDEVERKCLNCSGTARRVVSQSSFILKGSGWYLTDYARKPDKQGPDRKTGEKEGAPSSKKGTGEKSSTKEKPKASPAAS